ncbi:universal stress protein [Kitasatospora sp. GAS204B]|uniref:universal stress protein n=1 Tax=unclassified Kitasatospora TaxID=2633591 RepID=UPI0024734CE2|nr:universal stress protein [Kitasatospora sp. GAS204B]MDH6121376.1 nucleotide-binding universal stress UspA family protein [Kitasatospora sp. GAS204B]
MSRLIIAGFDVSTESTAATDWAAREARRRGLPLELIQAWPGSPSRPLGTGQAERWGRQRLADQADAIRARFPELDVRAAYVPDDPVAVLEAAADRATMLVLGSRGLGTLRGFVVGSVSQQVLGRANCPVVLVRAEPAAAAPGRQADEPPPAATGEPGVTVGLDLEHPYEKALAFAFEAASLHRVPLTAVRVWEPPPGSEYLTFGAIASMDEELEADERRRLDAALAPWRERYPDLPAATELLRGHAGIALVEAAAHAGLLVIGARHRSSPLGAHLGPVAHAVIHHVRCPVAVVPFS